MLGVPPETSPEALVGGKRSPDAVTATPVVNKLEARKPLAKKGAWRGSVFAWKIGVVPVPRGIEGVVARDVGDAFPVPNTTGGAVAVTG